MRREEPQQKPPIPKSPFEDLLRPKTEAELAPGGMVEWLLERFSTSLGSVFDDFANTHVIIFRNGDRVGQSNYRWRHNGTIEIEGRCALQFSGRYNGLSWELKRKDDKSIVAKYKRSWISQEAKVSGSGFQYVVKFVGTRLILFGEDKSKIIELREAWEDSKYEKAVYCIAYIHKKERFDKPENLILEIATVLADRFLAPYLYRSEGGG